MAAAPVAPPLAVQQGVSGTVRVAVTLDADSHVQRAVVTQAPSALLDSSALAAVQQSTFGARIVNCVPQAGPLAYFVVFPARTVPGDPPEMSAYFMGTWYCASLRHAQGVQTFGRTAYGSAVLMLGDAYVNEDKSLSATIQRYSEANGVTTVTGDFQGRLFIGTSRGWKGDVLVFEGDNNVSQRSYPAATTASPLVSRMTIAKSDANHYTRIFASAQSSAGPWADVSRESCARIVPAAPGG
jgi:TonB family protein